MEGGDFDWREYIDPDFSLTAFHAGSNVLDIGCGQGRHLRKLRDAGCQPVGVEPDAALVETLRGQGFDVHQGFAECLPAAPGSLDGLVCSVVLPYTDERAAVAEWGRVLRPGGEVRATYHGVGYHLRYLLAGPNWKLRAYGLRSILATWWFVLAGRRMPGWLGDTLYQSTARLERYYGMAGLAIVEQPRSKTYLGVPVFIAHRLKKLEG